MAIIENIINVLVPLLICGLIFIYFRRRITNLEQSVDIIMKMLQTNQLNNGGGLTNTIPENAVVTPDDVYVPSNDDDEIKRVEMNLEENDEESDDDESDDEESEEDEEESSSESESEHESTSETDESRDKLSPIQEEHGSLIENEVTSFLETSNVVDDTLNNVEEGEESKTVLLSQDVSEKDELEKKTVAELKKLLKERNPDVNNLSRMNKATLIENLIN